MHKLLVRQLKQHIGSTDAIPSEWQGFIAAIDNLYQQTDKYHTLAETPIELASDEPQADFQQALHDATERQWTEEQLRRSEMQLREAQQLAHLGSWEWDIATDQATWSDELYRIFGLEPQEFAASYEAFLSYVHTDDKEQVIQETERFIGERIPAGYEYRIICPDGAMRIIHAHAQAVVDEATGAIRVIGAVQDITERKHLEEQLQSHADAQTQLLHQLMHAQEAERRRLSMDIHDGPLQSLGVSLVALDRAIRRLERGEPEIAERELSYLRGSLATTVSEVRAVLADLSLEVLNTYGLVFALRSHIKHFSHVTDIAVDMCSNVRRQLPANVELLMYRLAQEALANVRKHADARNVSLRLRIQHNTLWMTISDDGKGFDPNAVLQDYDVGEKLGLRSMRERVQLAGGGLSITSSPSKGASLEFWCAVPHKKRNKARIKPKPQVQTQP